MNRNVRDRQPVRRDEYPLIKTQILNMCIGAVIPRHRGGGFTRMVETASLRNHTHFLCLVPG